MFIFISCVVTILGIFMWLSKICISFVVLIGNHNISSLSDSRFYFMREKSDCVFGLIMINSNDCLDHKLE